MKKVMLTVLVGILAMALNGCWETSIGLNNPSATDGPTLGGVDQGTCQTAAAAKMMDDGTTDSASGSADASQGNTGSSGGTVPLPITAAVNGTTVTVTHHGAIYQCDAQVIFSLQAKDANLILTEVESAKVVSECKCARDLKVDLLSLTAGKTYHIEVWNATHTMLFGSVDILVGPCDTVCKTDSDCQGKVPAIGCKGYSMCIEGQCQFRCQEPAACQSDMDCPAGFQCVLGPMPLAGEGPGTASSGTADSGTANKEQAAESAPSAQPPSDPGMPAKICKTDAECPQGMTCQMQRWMCPQDNCPEEGICVGPVVPPQPAGVCLPVNAQCKVPEDCNSLPVYFDCMGHWTCLKGLCDYQCGQGGECMSDRDCKPGSHCEFYMEKGGAGGTAPAGNANPTDPAGQPGADGKTTPPNPGCACPEYYSPACGIDGVTYGNDCEAKCKGVAIAYPGECKTAPQYGMCVPDVIDSCQAIGGACYPLYWNSACPEGTQPANLPIDKPLCAVGGMCCVPAAQKCISDDDCLKMAAGPADTTTAPAKGGRFACVSGVCQWTNDCNVFTCHADADCGPNMACVKAGWCDSAGNCCETTQCVPVKPPVCGPDAACQAGEVCLQGKCVPDDGCKMRDPADGRCLCGGFMGLVCPAGQECLYDDPACDPLKGGADCMGHCGPVACACPAIYAPVCGTDGKTYSSKCEAACFHVEIAYEGPCKGPCPMTPILDCKPGWKQVCKPDANGCDFCDCVFTGGDCLTSADCKDGGHCSNADGECLPAPGCNPDLGCLGPPVCYGMCRPPAPCKADTDCKPSQFCNTCPPDPNCPMCAVCGPQPVCMDRPTL